MSDAADIPVQRPALRWHGGKWLLAPWIISHFPKHRTYVEPYGGAASVLLRKQRCYSEVYNDLDGDVVNLFRVLRSDDAERFRQLLINTPFARDEFRQAYKNGSNDMERARNLVIRSFMGFGSNSHAQISGFRADSNKSGTTPAHDWKNYPDALPYLIERLRGVVIENRDATQIMEHHDSPETLHYVDPPYVHSTRGTPSKGYRHEMKDEDHLRMAETLLGLKGSVILSGYHNDIYDQVLGDWTVVEREARADGARPRLEVLWINPKAHRARHAEKHRGPLL